jgi:hypothetical protein
MRVVIGLAVLVACSDGAEPVFPATFAGSYVEVRDCRSSSEHELHRIRVLADPAAQPAYAGRSEPFPTDAIVLKIEYDFADTSCAGSAIEYTAMRKTAGEARLGWQWQRVTVDRDVESENDPRCITCHTACGVPPDGYLGTCAVP